MRVLIKIYYVRHATVDREIAGPGSTNISVAGRRPTEQVLRPKIAAISTEARTQTDGLINFVFRRTLSVEAAWVGRSGELIWLCRIEGHDRVIRPARPNVTVCKHCWRRVQPHCPAAGAGRTDVRRESRAWQTCVRLSVVTGRCIRSQRAEVTIPWNLVNHEIGSRESPHCHR